ncbi:PEP-CTERM sorting domain-containing protein [Phycisphaerales bacterium AB-hyl4]|uniref:PEP-CTERM sorting domain-containing protein n=1 Tax=Natronomicrosphaera hydrolytica TaxID=3242702 RepID=A0ABV4U7D7_9BACT
MSARFESTTITTAIPEPASLGLLAIGGLVMLGGRRRRNR